jgi:hypothetical protein
VPPSTSSPAGTVFAVLTGAALASWPPRAQAPILVLAMIRDTELAAGRV